VDLTAEYCAVGETLTKWTNLTNRVSFVHASALEMPFDDASFDVVWTQHASMNISDKDGLYREIARVVRPGGRFAFFDILAGPTQPIHFPVPWAADQFFSFLLSPDETRALIASNRFRESTWLVGADLKAELDRREQDEPAQSGPLLDSTLLNGRDSAAMGENVARNLKEDRIVPAIGVYERL
jgi:SAM-dependent methyltransferase